MSRTYLSQSLEHPRGWPPRPSVSSPKEQLFQRIFPQGFVQSDYHLTKIVIHKGLHKAIRNFRSISFSISEAFHFQFPKRFICIFRGIRFPFFEVAHTAPIRKEPPASSFPERPTSIRPAKKNSQTPPLTSRTFPQQFPSQETSNLLHSPQKRSDIANEAQ